MDYKKIWKRRNRSERKLVDRDLTFTSQDLEIKFKNITTDRIVKIDRYRDSNIDNFIDIKTLPKRVVEKQQLVCRRCRELRDKEDYIKTKNSLRGYGYVCQYCRRK